MNALRRFVKQNTLLLSIALALLIAIAIFISLPDRSWGVLGPNVLSAVFEVALGLVIVEVVLTTLRRRAREREFKQMVFPRLTALLRKVRSDTGFMLTEIRSYEDVLTDRAEYVALADRISEVRETFGVDTDSELRSSVLRVEVQVRTFVTMLETTPSAILGFGAITEWLGIVEILEQGQPVYGQLADPDSFQTERSCLTTLWNRLAANPIRVEVPSAKTRSDVDEGRN